MSRGAAPLDEADLYALLARHGVAYERVEHPPVFTCQEADALVPSLAGVHTKNLFLRDAKGRRHFLVVVDAGTRVDLQGLAARLQVSKLGMASPERLLRHLGVAPGAVTVLGVVNAEPGAVEVVFDAAVWADGTALHCHPLVNTATLSVASADLARWLDALGHPWTVLAVPGRAA